MIEFNEGDNTLEELNVEEELRYQIQILEEELNKYKKKDKYSRDIKDIIERQSNVPDKMYRTLYLYLTEVLDIVNKSSEIDLQPIKSYLEDLLDGVRVELYVGKTLYERLYDGMHSNKNKGDVLDASFMELYDLSTSDEDVSPLLEEVESNESLVELSDRKLRLRGFGEYKGGVVWVMDDLLGIPPGFAVLLLKNEKFLTHIQRDIVVIYMKMVQHVLYSKILTRRLTEEVNLAIETAHTDALTKIYNRQKFNEDYLNNENAGSEYIAYLDMCRLKMINDEYGHDSADKVIVRLAKELRKYAEDLGGRAYRIGGDEFTVSIPADNEDYEIKAKTEDFKRYWSSIVFESDKGVEFTTNVSIGIFKNKHLNYPRSQVIKMADKLMYKSKEDKENYTIHYNF